MEQKQRRTCKRRAFAAAFPHTIPVLTGFLVLGIAYGVLMQQKGYGVIWAVLMSAIAFCGSMQFVAITLLTTIFQPVQAFLLGTALGGLLGNLIPFRTEGLDFALTALFVVLFLEQWKEKKNRMPALIGLGATVLALLAAGPNNMVIPAMVLILLVLLGGRNRLCD